jgi:hypothetical protein
MRKFRLPRGVIHGLVFMASVVASGWLVLYVRDYVVTFTGLTIVLTNENKGWIKYGVGGWLIWMPFLGIASLAVGTAIAGFFRKTFDVALWYVALIGAVYSAVFFVLLVYVPLPEWSGRPLAAYILLVPAAIMAISPLIFRPSISSSQRDRPHAGGG